MQPQYLRLVVLAVCVFFLTLPAAATSGEKPAPTETVIRMKVQAARAPKPALKYQLLPEFHEMNPGNPVQGYLGCFSEQNPFFFNKKLAEDRYEMQRMPLKELPVKKLRGYGGLALTRADEAARLDNPDWQILMKLKTEGYGLVVSDLQQMRLIAVALHVRFRGEVADRRFNDALVTAKTMLALSRHMGEHPTLIGFLVGNAIASMATEALEEMLHQPGCPNLFWALTNLPHPLVDLRKGCQGERIILMNEFGALDEKMPMTDGQLEKVLSRFQYFFSLFEEKSKQTAQDWLKVEARVLAARKHLIDDGLDERVVKQFPALQVVLLNEKHRYEERRDDALKAMTLPFWQSQPLFAANRGTDDSPFARLLPSIAKVRHAEARLDQRLALLCCIEALRLHAAENNGKLPEKLADIKLPLPVDPVTGQSFQYKLEAGTAHLRGTPPAGTEKHHLYNFRYEINITK